MQTSSLRRQVKNMVNNYSEAEVKVREATSNDPWGPPSSLMSEIADLTFNAVAFAEVMGMIWKRLNDHGKNWRHVYKALTLLDYLVKTGSVDVAKQCRENIYTVQTLRDFQFTDRDGRDQGVNVREKAKQLVGLVRDEEKLRQERTLALKTKERTAGSSNAGLGSGSMPPPYPGRRTSQPSMAALYGDEFSRSRGSPSSFHSSSSSPRLTTDMEQARPQTSGEEELQLQLALAMSREETDKPLPVQPAARPPPENADMDEDTQFQLALSLSKQEHQQEQRSRQGDESSLKKALEESKREMEAKGGTSFMDLVDVFAVPAEAPPSDNPWDLSGAGDVRPQAAAGATAAAGPARSARSDPWDSLERRSASNTPGIESPWMAPPTSSSPAPPWERSRSPDDAWDAPGNRGRGWGSPANTDGDLFDEAMDGGQMNGDGSPELFDLSRLGDSLAAPSPRTCRTPETFLGPTGASLVNLDSLIPANPPAKNKNPFLVSGLSAPSAHNPFQNDQPRLTLNQMSSSSSSAATAPPPPPATSLPYSASLPCPVTHQPASLPSSLTHPTQPPLDLPGLPQPLLPLSSAGTLGSNAELQSQNPFL